VLVIRLDDESTMRIPRSWTDADGARAGTAAPEHVFTTDAMRALGALVGSLAQRSSSTRFAIPEGVKPAEALSRVPRATDATSGGDR